jgi:hypothetical protein
MLQVVQVVQLLVWVMLVLVALAVELGMVV